ncbi:streptophobe family protein, partial [Streptomyces sp. NPDC059744]|uniref:streptophobe family protein n=1 Tax=Streptomyces sp. NPDC059744 TaxID=3346929 RepID=UPI003655082C
MARDVRGGGDGTGHIPWGDVVLAAIVSVSWAMVAMAGTAALGLHLLGADTAGALGPMTAAVVVLGAGGSVSPSGDVSAFGLDGAEAHAALSVTPLGVGLAGALFLSFFFLRSLRRAGAVLPGAEHPVRAGGGVGVAPPILARRSPAAPGAARGGRSTSGRRPSPRGRPSRST